jgi:methylated-DNA-[protein]-cysteine S-methyltransferase
MNVPTDLDRRFRDAAARSGMLDAGYDLVDTPVGQLLVAATDQGLLRISYDPDPAAELERIAELAGPRVLRSPTRVDRAHRELDEYFDGRRHAFDLAIDLRGLTPFSERVLHELARVPFGQTATYATLAERAGNPKAARAVGTIMNRNPVPIVLPCHRIIGADGSLVGYAGGLQRKRFLLGLEEPSAADASRLF